MSDALGKHSITLVRTNKNKYEIWYTAGRHETQRINKNEIFSTDKYGIKVELSLRGLKIKDYLGSVRSLVNNTIQTYFFSLSKSTI